MDSNDKDGHCSSNNQDLPHAVNHLSGCKSLNEKVNNNNEDDWEPDVISTIPPVTKHVHYSDDDDWEGSTSEGHFVTNSGSGFDSNNWRPGVSLWEKETDIEDNSHQEVSSDGFRVNPFLNRTFAFAKRDGNRQQVSGKHLSQSFGTEGSNNNLDVDMVDASLCDQLASVSLRPPNYSSGAGATKPRRGRKRNSARFIVTDGNGNSWNYAHDESIDYGDGIPFEKYALVL